jgi:hypothetical protein
MDWDVDIKWWHDFLKLKTSNRGLLASVSEVLDPSVKTGILSALMKIIERFCMNNCGI